MTTHRTPLTWNSTGVTVISSAVNGMGFNPFGLFVDDDYFIYVAEKNNNRVTKWASNPSSSTVTLVLTTAAGELNAPPSLYVEPITRDIYVADELNNRVRRFPNGSVNGVNVIRSAGGSLPVVSGIFLNPNMSILITDSTNHKIYDWVTDRTIAGGNGANTGLNQLNSPKRIFVDQDFAVYVTEMNNNRVTKWEHGAISGTIVAGGNGAGTNANQLRSPLSVVVSSQGDIIVCDYMNNRIQRWNASSATGETIAGDPLAASGATSNRFNAPRAVAIDKDDNIYVADTTNLRIQRFNVL